MIIARLKRKLNKIPGVPVNCVAAGCITIGRFRPDFLREKIFSLVANLRARKRNCASRKFQFLLIAGVRGYAPAEVCKVLVQLHLARIAIRRRFVYNTAADATN